MAWNWLLNMKSLLHLVALAFLASETAAKSRVIKPICQRKCGDVSIRYPFGFGTNKQCYYNEDFKISCESGKPFLVGSKPLLQIRDILLHRHELVVYTPVVSCCYNNTEQKLSFKSPKFPFSNTRNRLTVVGCDAFGAFYGDDYLTGCVSYCVNSTSVDNTGSCSGNGCCQTSNMTAGLFSIDIIAESLLNHTDSMDFSPCSYAFVTDESYVFRGKQDLKDFGGRERVVTVIDWAIRGHNCSQAKISRSYACKGPQVTCVDSKNGPGYHCRCSPGYRGNPYITNGCRDICKFGSCESRLIKLTTILVAILLIVVIFGSFVLWRYVSRKRINDRKKRYFRKNGGLALQESLSQLEDAQNAFKIFTAKEMKEATNNFDEERIVGRGGFGVVYKGYLSDGREVAINKSKSVDKYEIDQFINEVVLLSKIQHQNVVGFYGCCLETSKPLLVYEFVANGTLLDHLYNEDNDKSTLSWETRVKIAVETAGVLGYLHQDHRPPIIHSDIKPHNILLDDDYNAKVSDFGISKSVLRNENELYTKVKGTFGYLDPEFIQSSYLTEKSDVYSFGVVLLELITGQRVVSFLRSERDRTLVVYFQSSVEDGSLAEILDKRISNEGNVEEFKVVAEIAGRCVSVKADERPTMKEVGIELVGLWMQVKNREKPHGLDINVDQRSGRSISNAVENYGNTSTSYADSTSTDQMFAVELEGGR